MDRGIWMRAVATLTVGLLLLTGCSTQPEVREPDPTGSASAETPSAPAMPAQAKEDSDEGRVAFATHFIETFNFAQSTGEVEQLARLSAENCEGCTDFVQLFSETYEAGGYFRGADFQIVDLAIDSAGDPNVVFARVKAKPTKYRTRSSEPEKTGAPQDEALVIELSTDPKERKVVRFERGL